MLLRLRDDGVTYRARYFVVSKTKGVFLGGGGVCFNTCVSECSTLQSPNVTAEWLVMLLCFWKVLEVGCPH